MLAKQVAKQPPDRCHVLALGDGFQRQALLFLVQTHNVRPALALNIVALFRCEIARLWHRSGSDILIRRGVQAYGELPLDSRISDA